MAELGNFQEATLQEYPNNIRNLKRWILIVGSLSQVSIIALSIVHVFARATTMEEMSWTDLVAFFADCHIFIGLPTCYLIGLYLTIVSYRNPGKDFNKIRPRYDLMFPTILPTVYCHLGTVCWFIAALEQAARMDAAWLAWARLLWTSCAVTVFTYFVFVVFISAEVCRLMFWEARDRAVIQAQAQRGLHRFGE
uniref:MARVEL domain-containing protein n=1 Tax=Steinernema glaseri TaxID=37863 RepID=A0A1I7Y7P7_9BILA